MYLARRSSHYALICVVAVMLAACAGQKGPAQKLIGDIEATVDAASGEAAKYVPDQLADVQANLASLKASFDKQDYAAVMTAGPAVLGTAQGLATAAAAKKDEILKALNGEWIGLAAALPGDVAALQSRIDLLSKTSSKKLAAGVDLDAAKSALDAAASLWSKAQGAFAAGNLEEAVGAAKDVKAQVEALAATLKIELPPPAALA
jgi:hypothetical protein